MVLGFGDNSNGFNDRDRGDKNEDGNERKLGGIQVKERYAGVLIDEIKAEDLYDESHKAGGDFDRYKSTEVNYMIS